MKLWRFAAAAAVSLAAFSTAPASGQSDRTLGINCTVAGHVHCGENGPLGGRAHLRGMRAYGAAHCRVVVRRMWRDGREVMMRTRRCY
jgi:hypothetical protein